MFVAEIVVNGFAIYLGLGILFAVGFVVWGIERIDPATRGTTFGFRMLLVPGAAALWPLLAVYWRRSRANTAFTAKVTS